MILLHKIDDYNDRDNDEVYIAAHEVAAISRHSHKILYGGYNDSTEILFQSGEKMKVWESVEIVRDAISKELTRTPHA